MRNGRQLFSQLPDIPSGTVELPPHISIIVPCGEDRENLVLNPSFELGTTSWSAVGGSIARSTTYSWSGAYSLQVSDTGSASAGATYSNVTVVSGSIYAVSLYVYFPLGGVTFTVTVAGVTKTVKSTGMWQRVVMIYKETASTTRTIAVLCNRLNVVYYIDAVQFELCSSDKVFESTYFDGDSKPLESERTTSSPYYWTGIPYVSSSIRLNSTRSGGRVINLKDIGFQLTAISGLGLSEPDIDTMEYSVLDGGQFNSQKKVNRSFTIAGRIVASSSFQYQAFMESLYQMVDMDSNPLRNPIVVKYMPMDNDLVQIGPEVDIVATYSGGLEGQYNNTIGSQITISFDQQTQSILGHARGYSLTPNATISSVAGIVKRDRNGVWQKLDTGIAYSISPTAVTVDTIYIDNLTKFILFGGLFDSAGSTSADYCVQYNPRTNGFSVFMSATIFNDRVRVIKHGLDNHIYFGGDFTNAGLPNGDRITRFNLTTGVWSALGTGANANGVYDIAFLPPESPNFGDLVAVGTFTLMGGVANTVRIAYWNSGSSTWSAMGTGANGTVNAVHAYYDDILGDVIIVGGDFTAVGGVANTDKIAIWHSFAWNTMGNADATVSTIIPYKNNILFTGAFNTIGGVDSPDMAIWNSDNFRQITSQNLGPVDTAYVLRDQRILFGGTGIAFTNFPDIVGILSNSVATPLNVLNPTGQINALSQYNDEIYVGFTDSVTITTDVITSVVSVGNSKAYPIIRFEASGEQYIYGIFNHTTNQVVFFNGLFLVLDETAIMDFDPINGYMVSDLRADSLTKYMEIGSTEFWLTGGTNRISVFADTGITITIWWRDSFNSVIDATGKI